MIRSIFKFCVPTSERLTPREAAKWQKEIPRLIRPLVDSCTSLGDCTIDLDSPKLPELVRILADLHKKNVAWLNSVAIEERVIDDEQNPVEWFLLVPMEPGECDGWDLRDREPPPPCRADRAKPGIEVVGWHSVFVAEPVKHLVETHRLSGVAFLWVKDVGKYRAPQWFMALAREPLGRGVDHPWLDPKQLEGTGYATKDPRSRHGQWAMDTNQFRPGAGYGNPLKDELIALAIAMSYKRRGFGLYSFRRYLRAHLPRTDFAAAIWDSQQGVDGPIVERRGLAISRRTRELFIGNRLVNEDECVGVMILDRPPKGVEDLDGRYGPPPQLFTEEDLTRFRAYEAAAWAEFQRQPKPVRVPDLKRSLALLKLREKREPKSFARPTAPKAMAEASRMLGREIPRAWQQVLRVSNGGRIESAEIADGHACTFAAVERLPALRRGLSEAMQAVGGGAPADSLPVIETEIGDFVCLEWAKSKSDGECPVVLMSHETAEREREWPSVAEFLEELLAAETSE